MNHCRVPDFWVLVHELDEEGGGCDAPLGSLSALCRIHGCFRTSDSGSRLWGLCCRSWWYVRGKTFHATFFIVIINQRAIVSGVLYWTQTKETNKQQKKNGGGLGTRLRKNSCRHLLLNTEGHAGWKPCVQVFPTSSYSILKVGEHLGTRLTRVWW